LVQTSYLNLLGHPSFHPPQPPVRPPLQPHPSIGDIHEQPLMQPHVPLDIDGWGNVRINPPSIIGPLCHYQSPLLLLLCGLLNLLLLLPHMYIMFKSQRIINL